MPNYLDNYNRWLTSDKLSDAEKAEQALLRQEYVAEIRASFSATLDSTVILNPDGTKTPLKSKKDKKSYTN